MRCEWTGMRTRDCPFSFFFLNFNRDVGVGEANSFGGAERGGIKLSP